MFCPRCGQQAAEEVRFCSRCGLPLDAAAEIVASGGLPTARGAEPDAAGSSLTPRQRGTRKGLMITTGGIIFLIIVAFLIAFKEDFFPFLILGGLILTAGVMRMLYALLLEEHRPGVRTKLDAAEAPDAAAELAHGRRGELPHARTIPVSLYTTPGADTNDMTASPPSVTESTTRLLDEDKTGRKHSAADRDR